MPTLLTARDLEKTFGTHTLFTGVGLSLHTGERLGLIGPNGAGKSTLLKILAGQESPDGGDLTTRRNLRLAYVPQSDRFAPEATPMSAVVTALNLNESGGKASGGNASGGGGGANSGAGAGGLDDETLAAITLSKLGFTDFDRPVATLSGGWRKRLSIACAVAGEPDVLMLDEPTNHLDLEGVLWLETFVQQLNDECVVFITHDRTFLESSATRIIELSRAYPGGTFEAKGNYSEFLRRKNDFLDAQAAQQTALAGKVRRDNAWLKQGIQGRQTRNKSQVTAAASRRGTLKNLDTRNKAPRQTTTIDFQATDRKTNRLLACHNLTLSRGDPPHTKPLFQGLDLELSPGTRLGLLGPNGSGKTSLLHCLTGTLPPDAGTVKPAAALRIVNFTQHRDQLNPTQSLREALAGPASGGGGDTVDYQGKPIHVSAWAKKFLFDPARFNVSVGDLSGGEQARILIAHLMLQPADVLILDEPTNDLDIPSLEVLETALTEFPGALVLVTHDRFLLRRISTTLLALDGQGGHKTFASYEQYLAATSDRSSFSSSSADRPKPDPRSRSADDARSDTSRPAMPHAAAPEPSRTRTKNEDENGTKKLTFTLQHELDTMEKNILTAESRLEVLQQQVAAADPGDHAVYTPLCQKLGHAQSKVDTLYHRWAELEAMTR